MSDVPHQPQQSLRDPQTALVGSVVRRVIPILVLVIVLAGLLVFWRFYDPSPQHEPAPAAHGPMGVRVVTVQPETLPQHLRFLGQTEGSQVVEIRARVEGYLQERVFTEGELVEKGQTLFQIDPRPFEVDLARAEAQLQSAQAKLERAGQQLRRYEQLMASQSATSGELEEWQKEERVAAADVALGEAEVAAAKLELEYATIVSPVGGRIGEALKQVGSYVDSGSNGLVAVVQQVDPIYIRFSVTEKETLQWYRQIEEGTLQVPEVEAMDLQITLADGSVYPHMARINYLGVVVDETTGTSIVRGAVANPEGRLKPGQFIHVHPQGVNRVSAIAVPQYAVMHSPAGASVYVLDSQSKVEARPVVLGDWTEDGRWVIDKGLREGERVITTRLMMLRPGMAAEIQAGPEPESEPATPAP